VRIWACAADHHRRLPAETRPLTPAFQSAWVRSTALRRHRPPVGQPTARASFRSVSPPPPEPAETGDFVVSLCSPASGGSSGTREVRADPMLQYGKHPRSFKLASLPSSGRPGMEGAPFPAATRAVMPKAAPGTAPAGAGPRCAGSPPAPAYPTIRLRSHLPARFIGHNSVLWPGKTPGPSPPLLRITGPRARPGQGRVPALRQPARHGSRRAESSAAFGDWRGVLRRKRPDRRRQGGEGGEPC
jgi:hypothetical protein